MELSQVNTQVLLVGCMIDLCGAIGTNLANCQFLASDIKTCQAKGKIVTISLGGAFGSGSFTSDSQASTYAASASSR